MGHEHRVEGTVEASPEVVYGLISDIDAQARWNPAFDETEWIDGVDKAEKGARFLVRNVDARFDWSVDTCTVVECDAPKVFSFVRVHHDRDAARWTYTLEPQGSGTHVTIDFEVLYEPPYERIKGIFRDVQRDADRAAERIMAGLQAAARQHTAA